jgi:Xaa-Pro aminopeptidase
VTDLVNVRYLTGFTGSNGALLLHADSDARSRFGTDGRYRTQAAAEVPDLRGGGGPGTALALAALAGELGVTALGFESDAVTVDAHTALAQAAPVPLHRAPGLTAGLRAVKDETEVDALRTACAAADAALADLLAAGGLAPRRTERDVALDLEAACAGTARRARRSRRSSRRGSTRPCRTTGPPAPSCAAATWSPWTSAR